MIQKVTNIVYSKEWPDVKAINYYVACVGDVRYEEGTR